MFCLMYKKYSLALRFIFSRNNSQITYCIDLYFMWKLVPDFSKLSEKSDFSLLKVHLNF